MSVDNNTLWLPGLQKEIVRPWFLPSVEQLEEARKLLNNNYFLVRQGDAFGERLRCSRCNNRHDYITLMCIERPFARAIGGLYAYYRAVTDYQLENDLSPVEQGRYNETRKLFNGLIGMEDLSKSHPQYAQQVRKGMSDKDMLIGAISLGILEAIAQVHAFKLVRRINDAGLKPKLVLGS